MCENFARMEYDQHLNCGYVYFSLMKIYYQIYSIKIKLPDGNHTFEFKNLDENLATVLGTYSPAKIVPSCLISVA